MLDLRQQAPSFRNATSKSFSQAYSSSCYQSNTQTSSKGFFGASQVKQDCMSTHSPAWRVKKKQLTQGQVKSNINPWEHDLWFWKLHCRGNKSPQGRNSSALVHLGHSKMACVACNSHDLQALRYRISNLTKFEPGTLVSRLKIVQNNFSPSHWGSTVHLFSILEVQ